MSDRRNKAYAFRNWNNGELQIIKYMVEHGPGRFSSQKLSKETGIPLTTVQRKLKKLRGHYFDTAFTPRPDAFGYSVSRIILYLYKEITDSDIEEIEGIISIHHMMQSLSDPVIMVDVIASGPWQLEETIKKIMSNPAVKNVEWYYMGHEHVRYLPENIYKSILRVTRDDKFI